KAEAQTGSSTPNNDPFWVDLVSHEIGHQFGADHTFNATTDSCGSGNRNATTAYEPGSGSTIMAYAGICSPNDVQNFSDDYFHAISLQQMTAYILGGGTCAATSAPGNQTPEVSAGPDYAIPVQTPFTLTATGSDPNGDTLTYCWEQWDLGAANALTSADTGVGPLFRSLPPSTSPSRTLPKLSNLLSNTASNLEKLPAVSRTMHFRCTVRDNRAGGGGTAYDDVALNVVGTAGPFRVTAPNTAGTRSGNTTVTWDVAGTTAAPILCSSVNILLSTDGGNTWPTTLRLGTPNDGSETVTLPNLNSSTARIRVEAAGNIFFDVSDANFTLVPGGGAGAPVFGNPGGAVVADTLGNGNGNGRADPGETALELTLPVRNIGSATATGVSATLAAVTAGITLPQNTAVYPDLPVNTTGVNAATDVVGVPAGHACGAPFPVRLTVRSLQATNVVDYTFTTGAPATEQVFSFAGASAIPDGTGATLNIALPVSGVVGNITDVNFAFTGTNCGVATGTGLQHPYVSDLTVVLRSPTGTEVTLMQEIGLTALARGPNFCGTVLDDSGTDGSIQDVGDDAGPYTGTFTPFQSLSAFNNLNANGTWTLKVTDNYAGDSGTVRGFSVRITGTTTCTAPDSTPASANLALAAVTTPATVSTSSVTRTVLTVNNLGPDPCQAAVLTVPMPAGVQSVSFTPAGTQQGSNLVFGLGNIASGANKVVTIDWNLGLATPGPQTRTASVTATTADPSAPNNSAAVNLTVADLDGDTLPDFNDPDMDGDALPNDWELAFFGGVTNALPSAHGDTDSFTNLQEYIAATDP
ncbi:MAG: M12 family metallo-peptidase, partial [Nakamurella multipartita]